MNVHQIARQFILFAVSLVAAGVMWALSPAAVARAENCMTKTQYSGTGGNYSWFSDWLWSCNHFPTASDDAYIQPGTQVSYGSYVASVNNLTNSGIFSVNSGQLAILGNFDGTYGSVSGNGALSFQGTSGSIHSIWGGYSGFQVGLLSVEVGNTLSIQNVGTYNINTLAVYGTVLNLSSSLTIYTLNISTGGRYEEYGTLNIQNSFENSGTFIPNAGTTKFVSYATLYPWVPTTFHHVEIDTGGTLVINSGSTNNYVTVNGQWTNNGGFVANNKSVTFGGSVSPSITGSSTTTFYDLTVNKSGGAGLSLSANVTIQNNLNVTAGWLDLGAYTANGAYAGGTLAVSNGATLRIGGANSLPANYLARTFGASSTVEYNGANQSVTGGVTYGHLAIAGTGTKTLAANTNVAGNLSVGGAATLDLGAFTANRASGGGALTVGGGATLQIGGANSLPGNYAAANFGVTSTVIYSGTAQSISPQRYGHLTAAGSLTKTLTAATTVSGTLTIGAGAIFSTTGQALNVAGSFVNNGAFLPLTGTVTFDGATVQTVTLASATTFYDLRVLTDTVLVEADAADRLFVGNQLTNYGAIRKTQPVAATGVITAFGLAGRYGSGALAIDVTDRSGGAPLTALQVDRYDGAHPNAPGGTAGAIYWRITPAGSDYATDLTLPHDAVNDPAACRYAAGKWQCAVTSATNVTVTRGDVTAFSDWTVYSGVTTTLALTTSAETLVAGQPVTFTATLSPATAIGAVQFALNGAAFGPAQPVTLGVAELVTTSLAGGTYTVTAVYEPESLYLASAAGPVTTTVTKAATAITVTAAPNPAPAWTNVTVTVTVPVVPPGTGAPTGAVTLTVGSRVFTPALTAGAAAVPVSDLARGAYSVTAAYDGDDAFFGSTVTGDDLVVACSPALTVTSAADAGPGSLRQAVADICPGGAIGFNLTWPATITLTSGPITLTQDVTITGPGAEQLAISGNHATSIFTVDSGVTAAISEMTLRDGDPVTGAVLTNNGTLGLTSGTLTLLGGFVNNGQFAPTGGVLTLGGDLVNTGTFAPTGGVVNLVGPDGQQVTGPVSFSNLVVLNSNGVTATHAITVAAGLTVTTGATLTLQRDATLHDVVIASGGTLVAAAGSNLTVSGNWSNDGTFVPNGGTVTFAGSGGQTIGGSTPPAFANLVLNGAGPLTSTQALTVTGGLTVTTGVFAPASGSQLHDVFIDAGGTLDAPAGGTLDVSGDFINDGVFNPNGSVVTFDGSGGQTIGGSTPPVFANLVLDGTGPLTSTQALSVTNQVTLTNGVFLPATDSTFGAVSIGAAGVFSVTSGYAYTVTGALTNAGVFAPSGGVLTIGGDFANSGTFAPTGGEVTIGGDLNNNGVFAPTGGDVNISGDIHNSGDFAPTGGTVHLVGPGGQAVTGSPTFANLVVDNSDGVTATAALTVTGGLTVTTGVFAPASGSQLHDVFIDAGGTLDAPVGGILDVSGDFINDGVFNPNGSVVTFDGSGGQTIGGSTPPVFDNLVLDGTGPLTSTQALSVTNQVTLTNGVFLPATDSTFGAVSIGAAGVFSVTSGYAYTVTGALTNAGVFAPSGGVLTIGGDFANSGTFAPTGGEVTIGGDLNNSGVFAPTGGDVNVSGDINNMGTFAPTGGTVHLVGPGGQAVTGAPTFANLVVDNSDGVTATAALTVTGGLTVTTGVFAPASGSQLHNVFIDAGGTLDAPVGGILDVSGDFINDGVFNPNGSVVTFDGSGGQTIGGSTPPVFANLVLDGTGPLTSTQALTVTGGLTVTTGVFAPPAASHFNDITVRPDGTLQLPDGEIGIGGDYIVDGTVIPGTGTVTFDGSGAQLVGGINPPTFNNLVIAGTGPVTGTAPITVTGGLTVTNGIFAPAPGTVLNGVTVEPGGTFNVPPEGVIINGPFVNNGQTNVYLLFTATAGTGIGIITTQPPASNAFAEGTGVVLTATANAGSIFMAWSGDIITSTNPTAVTMTADQHITATFTLCPVGVARVNWSAGGANSGESWPNAFTTLQQAFDRRDACGTFDEIWVATGVYTPGLTVASSFSLPPDAAIYGGFAATETLRTQRDWTANVTVLSGDLAGDDTTDANGVVTDTANIRGDNAWHVIWAEAASGEITGMTRLDGFVVTAGSATGSEPDNAGGGIYCNAPFEGTCSPTIANVIFSGNYATFGGGALFNYAGDANCSASPTLVDVQFINNAVDAGGAGGALYNWGEAGGDSSPALTDVAFSSNQAADGGGMYNRGGNSGVSSPALTNVTFTGNQAIKGGGMFNKGESGTSSPTLTNVTFSGNQASSDGGGMFNAGVDGVSSPILVNVILWGNTATSGAQISNTAAVPTLAYSLVEGGCPTNATCGAGMRYSDPRFVAPIAASNAPTTAGDYRLQFGSPAIDAGNNLSVTVAIDLDGAPRIRGLAVDMGAYEAPPEPRLMLVKQVTPAVNVAYGSAVTYTLLLSNTGNLTDTATLTDTLPGQVAFGAWVQNAGAVQAGNAIIWTGAITPATVLTFTFTATHSYGVGAAITNTAFFSGSLQSGSADAAFTPTCAAAITVQNTNDSGAGSLRQAIADICPGGVIDFNLSDPAVITLTSGELTIARAVTIRGPDSGYLAVSGARLSRVFSVTQGVAATIANLTIRDGDLVSQDGAGIHNAGVLTITGSALVDSAVNRLFPAAQDVLAEFEFNGSVQDSSGAQRDAILLGGIYTTTTCGMGLAITATSGVGVGLDWSQYAELLVHPFSIEMVLTPEQTTTYAKLFGPDDNQDAGWYYRNQGIRSYPDGDDLGSGTVIEHQRHYLAFVSTSATTMDVYFQGVLLGSTNLNIAAPPTQAIFFKDDSGSSEQLQGVIEALRLSSVSRSAGEIAAVQARVAACTGVTANGGGAYNTGALTLINSTVANNSARNGGGIANAAGGTLTLVNDTIADNAAATGGGILNAATATLHYSNTLAASSAGGGDCVNDGNLATNSHNLVADGSCSAALRGDPVLGVLGDYGGATPTLPLLPGSPAIDAGDSATCAVAPVNGVDQRGVARPQGAACDIGAFESRGFSVTGSGGSEQHAAIGAAFAQPLTLTVASAYTEPVVGGQVVFTAPVSGASINPTVITRTVDAGSAVTAAVTANQSTGSYVVTGAARGFSGSATYTLTNDPGPTTTALGSAPATAVFGQGVTFTATVTVNPPGAGMPTGVVTFTVNSADVPVTLVAGVATYLTDTLAVGSHVITATYGGNASFTGSSDNVTQVVNRAATSTALTRAPATAVFGQRVTFTATVTVNPPGASTPTGVVTFTLNSAEVPVTLVAGVATYVTDTLPVASHVITATYGGNASFTGSSDNVTQVVNRAATSTALTRAPATAVFGQSVTFTATVTVIPPGAGTPTGVVTFTVNSAEVPVTLVAGVATYITDTLPVASHVITATYGGNASFTGSSDNVTQVVNRAATSTALTHAPATAVFGQSVTFTATVNAVAPGAGTPTEVVTFTVNSAEVPVTLVNGVATYITDTLPVASHVVTATYGGGDSFVGSRDSLTQTVNPAETSTALSSAPNPSAFGQAVTFTATVTVNAPGAGTPSGVITFTTGASEYATPLAANGMATVTTASLPVGSHVVTATYGGSDSFVGSSDSLTQTVTPAETSTALSSAPNPSATGQSVTFTATVTANAPGAGTPTGAVTFTTAGGDLATVNLAGGAATVTTASLPIGSHVVTATYSGDGSFVASLITTTHVVARSAVEVAFTPAPSPATYGQAVGVAVTVTAQHVLPAGELSVQRPLGPGGVVTLYDGVDAVTTAVVVNGLATAAWPLPATGVHTLTVVYSGDDRHAPGAAADVSLLVAQAATTSTLAAPPAPTIYGAPATFTVTVQSTLQQTTGAAPPTPARPTGLVQLQAGDTVLGVGALVDGVAVIDVGLLAGGVHTLTAAYAGDANYLASTAAAIQHTVLPALAQTSLVAAPNPAALHTPVIFTATVQAAAFMPDSLAAQGSLAAPTGEVTFLAGATVLGDGALANGVATFTSAALAFGDHTITAQYAGDANYQAALSTALTQTITAPTPLAVNDAAGVLEGAAVTIAVLANDHDPAGGGLTVVAVSQPAHGATSIDAGGVTVQYAAATGVGGVDSFTYTLQDVHGQQSTATVVVVVTVLTETDGAPQVAMLDPTVQNTTHFTSSQATVTVDAPAGVYTGTLAPTQVFFLSYTPIVTPTQHTLTPPGTLQFGNFEFELTAFLDDQPLHGLVFVQPLVLTIRYDPALLSSLEPATLGLFFWDGAGWSTDGVTLLSHDPATATLIVSIAHLSEFAFFAAAAPTDLEPAPEPNVDGEMLYLPTVMR